MTVISVSFRVQSQNEKPHVSHNHELLTGGVPVALKTEKRVWNSQTQSFGISPMVLRLQPLSRGYSQLASGTSGIWCKAQRPGTHNCWEVVW
jgi:hypothetical protein